MAGRRILLGMELVSSKARVWAGNQDSALVGSALWCISEEFDYESEPCRALTIDDAIQLNILDGGEKDWQCLMAVYLGCCTVFPARGVGVGRRHGRRR